MDNTNTTRETLIADTLAKMPRYAACTTGKWENNYEPEGDDLECVVGVPEVKVSKWGMYKEVCEVSCNTENQEMVALMSRFSPTPKPTPPLRTYCGRRWRSPYHMLKSSCLRVHAILIGTHRRTLRPLLTLRLSKPPSAPQMSWGWDVGNDPIERFLLSLGYRQVEDGRWQDKNGYEKPKDKMEAYEYEIAIFN